MARRVAPDDEFVRMYRHGIPTAKIAVLQGVSVTTVRYHVQIAAQADPRIRDEHKNERKPQTKRSEAGLRNLEEVLAFYKAEGRLPTTGGDTPRERALGVWLLRRRQDLAEDKLSPTYREGLSAVPEWESRSSYRERQDARWKRRLTELVQYKAQGNDWPRHQKAECEEERVLGVWLHVQRISQREGKLEAARELKLTELLPGWRIGRVPGSGRRSTR